MAGRMMNLLILLTALLFYPPLLKAQVPPHDASNAIGCRDCHSYAIQNGIFKIIVPRGEAQETTCKNCHNPSGQASGMSNVGNHLVNGGSTIVDCGSCHDPHSPDLSVDPHTGLEAENLKLIRNKTRHVAGALDLAVFQQSPEHFAFTQNNQPWNGICQTCHTQTSHHTNNITADHEHEIGSNCTSCHPHAAGFAASGGGSCTGCHSNPQDNGDGVPAGGRRAVVGEFPVDNAHAHYGGVSLDSGSCLVCHSVASHMDGTVDLMDPDNGSMYTFVSPGDIASTPDLSDFCAHCHDADGAQRLAAPFDPFGNGNTPPDVATRFLGTLRWNEWYGDWCFGNEGTLRQVNSHHDIGDADQAWSGAKLECLNCHGSHNASQDTPLADPSNQTQSFTGDMNSFCLTCHDGGNGPLDPDFPQGVLGLTVTGPTIAMRGLDTGNCDYSLSPWWVDYTWTYTHHGPDSKRGWTGYSGAPGATITCTVCHDPHGSYTLTNTLGNPYMIRDYVDGTPFVDDGVRPGAQWTGPPWNTYGTAGPVVVSISGLNVDWGSNSALCSKCHATWLSSYEWHAYCNACQSCHGHGQAWGENDWVSNSNDTSCDEIAGFGGASAPRPAMTIPGSQPASVGHTENSGLSCMECHESH